MTSGTTILKSAMVLSSDGLFLRKDIRISDGVVSGISESIDNESGAVVYDCSSFFVVPGFVDLHVHLREPGQEAKETIATGTAAAARGGFTTVCAMPNLNPVPDSLGNLQPELEAIEKDASVKVLPYASITKGRRGQGEIVDMQALMPYVAGFSDDGCGVQAPDDMRAAMVEAARCGCRIMAHCEVESLLRGGYINAGRYCRTHGHKGISNKSEWAQVRRDCKLAAETGASYHVCHVSTRQSVSFIRRAKARGAKVTAETCPHYLLLTDNDLREEGRYKMNPPLRSEKDRKALLKGLEDGTIDCIATDHAPHTEEEKSRGLAGSAMGIVGLETAFPLLYTEFVLTGRWSLPFLIEKMSLAPRRILGLDEGLEEGSAADITVLDLEPEYEIDPSQFLSKGRSTPFDGWTVRGRVAMTFVDGKLVYKYE